MHLLFTSQQRTSCQSRHVFTWISSTAYGVVPLISYSLPSAQVSVCFKNVLWIMLFNCLKSVKGFPLYSEYNLNFFVYSSRGWISGPPFFKVMALWILWCYIHFFEYAKCCLALRGVFLCLRCLPTINTWLDFSLPLHLRKCVLFSQDFLNHTVPK